MRPDDGPCLTVDREPGLRPATTLRARRDHPQVEQGRGDGAPDLVPAGAGGCAYGVVSTTVTIGLPGRTLVHEPASGWPEERYAAAFCSRSQM